MKKLELTLVFISFLISFSLYTQVGIATDETEIDEIEKTAVLELKSTSKGFLMPRMTNEERLLITTPAEGLQVYVTDFEGETGIVMFYNGQEWKALTQLISKPDAPTIGTTTFSNTQTTATIRFTAPENDGGSSITSYTATSTPGGRTFQLKDAEKLKDVETTKSGLIKATGIDSNIFYTFTVTATNEMGSSPPSNPSNIVPPPKVGDLLYGCRVFYILSSGEPGFVSGETHGLICAMEDLPSKVKWSNNSDTSDPVHVGTTNYRMAYGKMNTEKIIDKLGTGNIDYAAYQAINYRGGNFDDWYLPSEHELNRIYEELKYKTDMQFKDEEYYWSSYEDNKTYALSIKFTGNRNGVRYVKLKNNEYYVRPIRSF